MQKRFTTLLLIFICATANYSQSANLNFFDDAQAFFKKNVVDGQINYKSIQDNSSLNQLIIQIEDFETAILSDKEKQAFYINAYNLQVINQIVKSYPIKSVMDKGGFFDNQKIKVAGQTLTLNKLEKDLLLKPYKDARFHFVLVCGANGCPPITNFAYTGDFLEAQLNQQTKLALNDPNFIKVSNDKVELSEIFKWYVDDFGGNNKSIINFINKYRKSNISEGTKISYYNYDWSLNDTLSNSVGFNNKSKGTNASRYIVSSTIKKGTFEVKIFNNLYSEKKGDGNSLTDRSSFFTTLISALYGVNNRLNIGLNTRYRKVRNNSLPSSPFTVFGSGDTGSSRSGLTAIGPQIRYAPVPKWRNFSIQSSFVFPIGDDLAGSSTQPYIDWTGATWNTQFFNDFTIGHKFSLFTEFAVLLEDIGSQTNGHVNRLSTPLTAIFSYTPTSQLTVYTLGGYSPYWQADFDYFYQFGLGAKYQFTPKFELELLYTDFTNEFLSTIGGQAETINLGIRFNI